MATMEQLRSRLARLRAESVGSGRVMLGMPALMGAAQGASYFLLAAVLAGGRFLDGAPFGLALVGGGGSGLNAAAALMGATVGYVNLLGLVDGLRYVSAAILTFSVAFAFYDVPFYRRPWTMPLVTAGMNACTGVIYLSQHGWRGQNVLWLALEVALTALFSRGFRLALAREGEDTPEGRVGSGMLAAAVLVSLAQLRLPVGVSLGGLLTAALVVSCAWQGGVGAGSVAGVAFGLAMDLAVAGQERYTMVLGAAGLATGFTHGSGRVRAGTAFMSVCAGVMLWGWSAGWSTYVLWECALGCGVFLALPEAARRQLSRRLVSHRDSTGQEELRVYVAEKLRTTARAFGALHQSLRSAFRRPVTNQNDTAVIYDRAADRVCRGCELRGTCWERDYVTTVNALNDAVPAMLRRGRSEAGDYPGHFSGRCVHFRAFLGAVNEELNAWLCRREYRNRIRDSRRAVCSQYAQLSRLLDEAAAELGQELTPDPLRQRRLRQHLAVLGLEGDGVVFYDGAGHLRVRLTGPAARRLAQAEEVDTLAGLMRTPLRVLEQGAQLVLAQREPYMAVAGVAARRRQSQTVSGDAGTWFRQPDGTLYMLLCDGMGSGEAASRESGLAVSLLEQFLKAGIEAQQALCILSGALALRGEEQGGFSTVDLLELDLFTGRAAIYKLGAAPTYLRTREGVRRITGTALPAGADGLGGSKPDCTRFTMAEGDCVLMVSDGVCAPEEDEWLRRELADFDGVSPKELAHRLVERDAQGEDDRTALVVRLARREG